MKTELQKLRVVAEACGWEFHPGNAATLYPDRWLSTDGYYYPDLSHFNTIDSIRSAVMQQSEEFQNEFECLMECKCDNRFYHQLTPSDWLDAFVETAEKTKTKTKT